MLALWSMYIVREQTGVKSAPSWPSLHEYLHFIPDRLIFGICLLTI